MLREKILRLRKTPLSLRLGPKGALLRMTLPTIFLLLGCNKLFPVDVGTSSGRGIVRRIDTVHHQVTLSHGTVPNLLNPMTYAYPVKSDAEFHGINEGDTVGFTIEESQPGSFRVLSMTRIHPKPRPRNLP